jgi:hypothetical protein
MLEPRKGGTVPGADFVALGEAEQLLPLQTQASAEAAARPAIATHEAMAARRSIPSEDSHRLRSAAPLALT